jgi:hypothetical protein
MEISISERVIEDILSVDKSIISEIISKNYSDLNLLARQKIVSSGILDLLYLHKDELILIELKVVSFYRDIIDQINGYEKDLLNLQSSNKILKAPLKKIILVTAFKNEDFHLCSSNNIELLKYSPSEILSKYYQNFKELSQFLKIQSGDFGVVRLGLLNSTLKYLGEGCNVTEISKNENKSEKTIKNRISVAVHLNLVGKFKKGFYLTDFGEKFNSLNNSVDDRLNEKQRILLADFVKENPFYSQITYTIFAMVESVFILSKNSYPVPKEKVKDYFVKSVGKSGTWQADKAKETATYIFSNYAIELEFLGVHFKLTRLSCGFKFSLYEFINRSINW